VNIELTALEARVIGCLIEKAITTPDQYPLSLNALPNACNQKSNRDPILDLDERTVQQTVDSLTRKHLILEKSGFGSRVQKYQHRFCNTGFGSFNFTPVETAILCELLVRGPQTPGELKTRAARMAPVNDIADIESALLNLATREDGPFVVQLPREAGRRDQRYAHLFSGDVEIPETTAAPAASHPRPQAQSERIEKLEELVAALRRELDELKQKL
jgi:uncharacterized protein YceH (UPF0502 family)